MATTVKMRIQIRRDTSANWELYGHLVPAQGEPCFVIDKNILKIGDGVTQFKDLVPINGVQFAADGESLVLEEGVLKLNGFNDAEKGAQLVKGEDGKIKWVVPSTDTVDGLQITVGNLQTDVATLKSDVADLKAIVGSEDSGSKTLLSRIEELEKEMDTFITGIGDSDEKINTLIELVDYIDNHGKEAADITSRIDDLYDLVGTESVSEQISATVDASEKKANALYEHVKYEITNTPAGTLVDYRDKEIRIMFPKNAEWKAQNVGEGGDASNYYFAFKAYAPEGAVSFKEDDAEVISDNTMYYFENNDFAGIDKYGRKYSIVWLAAAKNVDGVWTYYGAKSNKNKYIGWYYCVEWYDANGVIIGSDKIRINLSNEDCHSNIEPFYMTNVVKEVAVNGTLMDIVNGRVDITVPEIKGSDEIEVAEDGTLSVKKISFDKIEQNPETIIVMDGGNAV